jgi:hypothetical protein
MDVQANRGGVERLDDSRFHHDDGFQSLNGLVPARPRGWLAGGNPHVEEIRSSHVRAGRPKPAHAYSPNRQLPHFSWVAVQVMFSTTRPWLQKLTLSVTVPRN